jgi:hypothetical protein
MSKNLRIHNSTENKCGLIPFVQTTVLLFALNDSHLCQRRSNIGQGLGDALVMARLHVHAGLKVRFQLRFPEFVNLLNEMTNVAKKNIEYISMRNLSTEGILRQPI